MWIYKIKNIINNKIYIGQTVKNPSSRIKQHIRDSLNSNYKLHKAIKKYSINNFLISVLCKCHSLEDLNNAEIYFINYYNSIKNGYNIRQGGNKTLSESTKKKISKKSFKRYNISIRINQNIKKFILNNTHLGRKWIKEQLKQNYNISCSESFITKFIAKNKNQTDYKKQNNKISEYQKKEISNTLKNINELNRLKKINMSKEEFFKLGFKSSNFKEFYSYFKCPKSFIISCLKIWTGKNSFYEIFNKKRNAWNKKNVDI